jgi:hypothetical protein
MLPPTDGHMPGWSALCTANPIIQNPSVAPASLPSHADRIECRLPRLLAQLRAFGIVISKRQLVRLLLRAVRKHTDCPWVLLYIERWLKAPIQTADGSLIARESFPECKREGS